MARAPEDSPKEAKGEGEIPRMGDSPGKGHTILSRGSLSGPPDRKHILPLLGLPSLLLSAGL